MASVLMVASAAGHAQTAPQFTGNPPPGGNFNTAYSYTFTASGTPAPTFARTSGTLPPGLSLSSGGVLSGTPTAVGSYSSVITTSNGVSPAATRNITVSIQPKLQPIFFGPYPQVMAGSSGFLLAAGGTSGNPVSLSSGTQSVCTISGSLVIGISEGTCIILAFQAGNATHAAGTGTAIFEVVGVFALTDAFSRLTHPGFGDCDVPIDLAVADFSGAATVEPRQATSGRQVVLRFPAAITGFGAVTVTDVNDVAVGSVENVTGGGGDLMISLADIPDGKRVKVTANNVSGATTASVYLNFFAGDTSSSGLVSAADISAQKIRRNQPLSADNCRFDVNVSGAIDNADLVQVRSRSGQQLP
ncbi:MAG: hypothetical protein JNN20_06155 [Betaproteobacteria bacterium]|nr:hypothetical protein [Betaproteobacteria bacterium]